MNLRLKSESTTLTRLGGDREPEVLVGGLHLEIRGKVSCSCVRDKNHRYLFHQTIH